LITLEGIPTYLHYNKQYTVAW